MYHLSVWTNMLYPVFEHNYYVGYVKEVLDGLDVVGWRGNVHVEFIELP